MTKEVMIAIRGIQSTQEEGERIEVIVPGEYYYRNDKHFVLFDEAIEGTEQVSKSTIKIGEEYVELIRRGPVSTHMVFEAGRKNVTHYHTPYGSMKVGVQANRIQMEESDERISADILYLLDVDGQFLSENRITITVRPRAMADVHL